VIRARNSPTVRAEPVEAFRFSFGRKEGKGFDKLSPNGLLSMRGILP
jgi:hypothetical protein